MLRIENRFRFERSQICTLSILAKRPGVSPRSFAVRGVRFAPAPALSLGIIGAFAPDINGAGARAPISSITSITEGAGRGTDSRILAASLLESMKLLY